uniref:Ig-like domain-containing protein n=1 Tax=Oryzias melastigma TaxID=30732 RepID=A0A3B3DMJ6_ORYME
MILYVALCLTECRAQTDSVQQPGGDVTAAEGDSVTLGCHFNSSTPNYYLFWYKQEGNNRPMFILNILKTGTGTTAEETTSTSTELIITKLTLADTALYYCAVDTQ